MCYLNATDTILYGRNLAEDKIYESGYSFILLMTEMVSKCIGKE